MKCRNGDDLKPPQNDTHTFNKTVSCLGVKIIQPPNMSDLEFENAYNSALKQTAAQLDANHYAENMEKRKHLKK